MPHLRQPNIRSAVLLIASKGNRACPHIALDLPNGKVSSNSLDKGCHGDKGCW